MGPVGRVPSDFGGPSVLGPLQLLQLTVIFFAGHYGQLQWRSQDLEVGGTGGLGNGSPPGGSRGRAPGGWFGGGIASRKLIAVIKDIWLPNHAQFCVFSSTAQPGIFL